MADGFTENILGVADLVESGVNKTSGSGLIIPEGVVSDKVDVLDLPMTDEELLALRNDWEKLYAPYEAKMKPIFQRNLRSYLGRTKDGRLLDSDQPGAANLQFESEETFLPAALARNPDPLVYSDDTPEGNKQAEDVETMLKFHADQQLLRMKLKIMARHWSIYQLAVLKHGWDNEIQDIKTENRKIQDFIFDRNGFVDVYGDFSSWLGERITVTADKLIELFPKHKQYITDDVGGKDKLGTDVIYTEWWTDKFCFSTYKKVILEKHKNEYFKYAEDKGEIDEFGQPKLTEQINHFASPKKPYTFLSVFSLQERPHDITGLIEQNIPNQAKITKRVEQIDINVSKSNNSELYSENNFNQETAKQAANAIRNPDSGQVLVPAGGPINEAIVRLPAPGFPESAFKDLEMSENHLRSSWGVQGIASQEQKPDTTARGMVLNQGRDTSRIGGGISDIIEQSVAKSVFNWWVQLYLVFYDEPHFASILGSGEATQYITLSAQNINKKLVVSVAPNSMMPKDEVSIANEAQELAKGGFIGPKTLLERMKFPNADDAAADGILFRLDPLSYMKLNFPEQAAKLMQLQQEQMAQMAQAQQVQAQQEQQGVAQQQAQKAQAGQQQLSQAEQAHQQSMRHGEEAHQAKLNQSKEAASAKLAQVQLPK